MKKIILVLLITCSFLVASTPSQNAYEKGKSIASKIDKKTASTVRIQKCKYFILLEKSIDAMERFDAYKGCEDEVNKTAK